VEESADLGLDKERAECEANGIEFRSLPIVDRSVPRSDVDTVAFLRELERVLSRGANVAVHCRQGIGRSGLIAASLLMETGLNPDEAVRKVSEARRIAIPETEEQRIWIDRFGATLAHRT